MQVKGKVIKISDVQVISDKFKKCEVWLETAEQYSQVLNIQFTQEKADAIQAADEGCNITIDVNLRGRKYTNKQGFEGVFNTIEAYKYEVDGATPQQAPTQVVEDDSMPF
jgi:hypothetical protein